MDRFERDGKLLKCPECESPYLYKYGENFEAEFFECEDCSATFERRWNGKIWMAGQELEMKKC